jgi:hypothetical protein
LQYWLLPARQGSAAAAAAVPVLVNFFRGCSRFCCHLWQQQQQQHMVLMVWPCPSWLLGFNLCLAAMRDESMLPWLLLVVVVLLLLLLVVLVVVVAIPQAPLGATSPTQDFFFLLAACQQHCQMTLSSSSLQQ